MLRPPHILFVENVVGFETLDTHKQMIDFFSKSGFDSQEYILTPLQFGVPYSRPRYFCLAKRKPLSFLNPNFNNQLCWTFKPLQECWNKSNIDVEYSLEDNMENQSLSCEPIDNFFELKTIDETWPNVVESDCTNEVKEKLMFKQLHEDVVLPLDKSLRATLQEKASICQHNENFHHNYMNAFRVPLDLIERWGNVMDIVYPYSKRCCCFTKSYYRYVKGTGSFLATFQLMDKNPSKGDISSLKELGLRYFTPREILWLCSSLGRMHPYSASYLLRRNSKEAAVTLCVGTASCKNGDEILLWTD